MPDVKVPTIDLDKAAQDLTNAFKEAAYVAVGLGVLGFQRAQVQRVELTKAIESQFAGLSTLSTAFNSQAESYIAAAREQLTELRTELARISVDVLPDELPDSTAVRAQLTGLARSVDEALAPVRQQFEERLDQVEERLPEAAREFVQSVRAAAGTQEKAVRSAVGLD